MANYFRNFPIIQYDAFRTGNLVTTTNITKRFNVLEKVLNRSIIYYNYTIRDGERPDIVSHKMYGSVDYN